MISISARKIRIPRSCVVSVVVPFRAFLSQQTSGRKKNCKGKNMKKIFALAPAVFVAAAFITAVSSCGSALDNVKGDIETDIEQARTESYFRLYGLFENSETSTSGSTMSATTTSASSVAEPTRLPPQRAR